MDEPAKALAMTVDRLRVRVHLLEQALVKIANICVGEGGGDAGKRFHRINTIARAALPKGTT